VVNNHSEHQMGQENLWGKQMITSAVVKFERNPKREDLGSVLFEVNTEEGILVSKRLGIAIEGMKEQFRVACEKVLQEMEDAGEQS